MDSRTTRRPSRGTSGTTRRRCRAAPAGQLHALPRTLPDPRGTSGSAGAPPTAGTPSSRCQAGWRSYEDLPRRAAPGNRPPPANEERFTGPVDGPVVTAEPLEVPVHGLVERAPGLRRKRRVAGGHPAGRAVEDVPRAGDGLRLEGNGEGARLDAGEPASEPCHCAG